MDMKGRKSEYGKKSRPLTVDRETMPNKLEILLRDTQQERAKKKKGEEQRDNLGGVGGKGHIPNTV